MPLQTITAGAKWKLVTQWSVYICYKLARRPVGIRNEVDAVSHAPSAKFQHNKTSDTQFFYMKPWNLTARWLAVLALALLVRQLHVFMSDFGSVVKNKSLPVKLRTAVTIGFRRTAALCKKFWSSGGRDSVWKSVPLAPTLPARLDSKQTDARRNDDTSWTLSSQISGSACLLYVGLALCVSFL